MNPKASVLPATLQLPTKWDEVGLQEMNIHEFSISLVDDVKRDEYSQVLDLFSGRC